MLPGLPALDRCAVLGVLNVTPDSFSDGGRFADPQQAIAHGLRLAREGADLVDVGGESTRPGAGRVEPGVEADRIRPVVAALAAAGVLVSIDTTRASTASVALAAGARLVNDVSGGAADPDLARVVAEAGVPYVLAHSRGRSVDMLRRAHYRDVVAEVIAELSSAVERAIDAGVSPAAIVIDPGLGFAKRAEHNWRLLGHLDRVVALGQPVLVGASRKSFLGALLAGSDGAPRPTDGRDAASVAVTVLAAAAGVWGVRVHDVAPNADAVRVVAAQRAAATPVAAGTAR
jgi:dihydropteroate synthase